MIKKKNSDSGKFKECLSDSWIMRNSLKTTAYYRQKKILVPKDFVNFIKFKMHRLFEIWKFCWRFCTSYHLKSSTLNWFNSFFPIFFSFTYWSLFSPCIWSSLLLHLKALSLVIPKSVLDQLQVRSSWGYCEVVKAMLSSLQLDLSLIKKRVNLFFMYSGIIIMSWSIRL